MPIRSASTVCRLRGQVTASTQTLLTATEDLSLEFLMGRTLDNAMLNVGLKGIAKGTNQLPDTVLD